jgi:hypothetical protein
VARTVFLRSAGQAGQQRDTVHNHAGDGAVTLGIKPWYPPTLGPPPATCALRAVDRRGESLFIARVGEPVLARAKTEKTPGIVGFQGFSRLCAEGDLNPHPLSRTSTSS